MVTCTHAYRVQVALQYTFMCIGYKWHYNIRSCVSGTSGITICVHVYRVQVVSQERDLISLESCVREKVAYCNADCQKVDRVHHKSVCAHKTTVL